MQCYFVHMYTIAFNMTVCSCHILYSWKNYTEFTENVPRIQSFTGDNPPIDNEWNIQICLQLSRTHCLLNIKLKWFPIKENFLIPSASWKVNRKNWLSCRCWCCWQWVANYRLVRYLYSLFINLLDIENNL